MNFNKFAIGTPITMINGLVGTIMGKTPVKQAGVDTNVLTIRLSTGKIIQRFQSCLEYESNLI